MEELEPPAGSNRYLPSKSGSQSLPAGCHTSTLKTEGYGFYYDVQQRSQDEL